MVQKLQVGGGRSLANWVTVVVVAFNYFGVQCVLFVLYFL